MKTSNKYKTLLFDADRTLFDFDFAEYNAIKNVSGLLGIPFTGEVHSAYSAINDALWKQFEKKEVTREFLQTARFDRFLKAFGLCGDAQKINGQYLDFLSEGAYLLPDAKEVCQQLFESGYNMAIVTNGLVRAQTRRFNKSEIAPFFESIFISEEIGFQKPDVRYFEYVFDKMGITDLSSVLVIGDSLSSDIMGAKNAGVDSCWFDPSNSKAAGVSPDYTISKLTEIFDILA